MQCKLIRLIVLIVFVLIDTINSIDSIDRINCIDNDVLKYSTLQLKDNSNDTTNYEMNFWGKEGEVFEVTGI